MNFDNARFFEDVFLDVLTGHITPEQTRREVDYIESSLGLGRPSTLLDVGCGGGRHSIELARRGHKVTGLDASGPAIERARAAADAAGVVVEFIQGANAALEAIQAGFDGAVSWQTSLGIYPEEGGDAATLRQVARLLRPGAGVIIETTSLPWLIRNFVPQDWRSTGDAIIFERRTLDMASQQVRTESSVYRDGRMLDPIVLNLRIYTCTELVAMLREARLEVTAMAGSLDGEPYGLSSRRLILRAVPR